MTQQSPIIVPSDDSDDDVSVVSAGAAAARRLQAQFDAEARRARGDDEATQRLVARLAAPAVDDEPSLRLARSLAVPAADDAASRRLAQSLAEPSEDASLSLARQLSAPPQNELNDVLGRALASDEFTVQTASLRGETVASLVGAGFDCASGYLTLADRSAAFALYSRLEAAPPASISLGGRPLAAGDVLTLDGAPAMAPGFDPTKPQIGAIQCSGEKVSSSSTPSAPRRPAFDATEAKARRLKREAEHRREKEEKKRQREREVQEFRGDRRYRGRNGARATGITDAKWAESFGASGAADREKRVVVFNGPSGRHDGDNGNDHLAVLVKDLNGDKGRSLLDAVAAEIPGFATKVERNQGLSAAMAACVSGVARVSSDTQQMQNRYTEIKNSHQLGRAPDTRIVENLRASCFDPPMARLRELIEPRGVVAFQDGKYRQGYRRMQEFDHGQLLVHSYGKQGKFKNHFDQNSQVVCLHAVGNTCDFAVCFSDKCERHGSVDKETCPHCHVFKFESGDTLIFDASFDQQIGVCHGVVKILDEVAEGAAEKLPPYMKNKRVSIQWRGRRPEAVAAETVGERAEREGMRHRGEDPGDLATYRREKAMAAMREQQQNKKGGGG